MPDFTPDNTAPTAMALPIAVPDNAAPAVRGVDLVPDNGVPVAKAAGYAPDNTAPDDKGLPYVTASTEDGPGAKVPAGAVSDNVAPVAVGVGGEADNTAPGAKAPGVPVPDNTAPGAHAIGSFVPTADVPQPVYFSAPPAPNDENVNTPTILLPGILALNAITGTTRIAANSLLTRAQVQLGEAPDPAGDPAKILLVDANGDSIGVEITIPAGEIFGEAIIAEPIALAALAYVRAKCTQIGSAERPGGFGVVTLFTQLAA